MVIGRYQAVTCLLIVCNSFFFHPGSVAQVIGYAIDTPAPPFPALVLAYAINGFGLALQDAGANGYVASYKHGAATKMGILHAVYGL